MEALQLWKMPILIADFNLQHYNYFSSYICCQVAVTEYWKFNFSKRLHAWIDLKYYKHKIQMITNAEINKAQINWINKMELNKNLLWKGNC